MMDQEGFISRSTISYNNGVRSVENGIQQSLVVIQSSYHDYILNIRQKYSEEIFADRYASESRKNVIHGWELVNFRLEQRDDDDKNIIAEIQGPSGEKRTVRWYVAPP